MEHLSSTDSNPEKGCFLLTGEKGVHHALLQAHHTANSLMYALLKLYTPTQAQEKPTLLFSGMLQHLSSIEQPQVTYSKPHTLLRYQTSLAPEALQATKKDMRI